MTQTVLLEDRGAIAIVTLNRPSRRNGVTVAMCEELYAVLCALAVSDARVVILRGAGDDFCVGADIAGPAEPSRSSPASDASNFYQSSTMLHTMPQITIAAVDGGCAGAGMGWALSCDLRFGTARAGFSTAFLNVGVSGDMGLAWGLERTVGGALARDLMLFPRRVGGEEALNLGLVTRLYSHENLQVEALARAEELASRDPLALRLVKANAVSAFSLPLEEYIEVETTRHLQTTNRPEFAQLMAAGLNRLKRR